MYDKLKTYLIRRGEQIIKDISKLNADLYINIGRLREIDKTIETIEKIERDEL